MSPSPSESKHASLSDYRWKNRVLLVFGPAADDDRYERQLTALRERELELRERDVIVLPIAGSQSKDLRREFRVPPDQFTVILIGKDGGEKLRRDEELSVADLTQAIDAMPMRRAESTSFGAG